MDFCGKCGSILVPATDKGGRQIVKCPRCEKRVKGARLAVKEKVEREKVGKGVSEKEAQTMASVTLEPPCEKCGNTKAYHWSVQTRASDEPETEFFKCTKCKHTRREYS